MQTNLQKKLKKKTDSDKPLYLNPAQMQLTEYGIDDFFWPISRDEMESVRDELQINLTMLLREKSADNTVEWQVFRILMFEVIQEMLMTFQAVAIKNRARKAGRSIHATEEFRLYNALVRGDKPTPPRFSDWLWRGLKSPNCFVRLLRFARDLIPFGPFLRKRLILISRNKDTVAISTSPFMRVHAEILKNETGRKVVLVSFWEWFSINMIDSKVMYKTPALSDEVIANVISIAKTSFAKQGENFPELMINYFHDWIRKASIPVRFYYERMINQPDKLPKKLWYGSTNHLWTRMLRCAVQNSGGYCVGHDHGRGISTCPNRGEHGVVLDLCDEYVTYSPFLSRQFELLGDEIIKALPNERAPKFTGREHLCLPGPDLNDDLGRIKNKTNTSVMYLAPQYFGEKVFLNCLPSDVVTVDWQIRLVSALNSWGLNVLYKQHPENNFEIPSSLLSISGMEIVSGYIEECYNIADIFIFDFISSPFRTVAFSNKPMIFVDFGLGEISEDTYSVLSKRCAIISGWYDDDNRAQVNWSEMKEAVEASKKLSDDLTCVKTLFGAK